LVKSGVHDLEAGVPVRPGYDPGTPVVAVEARLCNEDSYLPLPLFGLSFAFHNNIHLVYAGISVDAEDIPEHIADLLLRG